VRTRWIAAAITAAIALVSLAAMTHERPLGANPVVVELFTSQG
jgi:hypothetical protein